MGRNKLSLIFKWRALSVILSLSMSIAANMYLNLLLLYLLVVWHLSLMVVYYVCKDRCRIGVLDDSCREISWLIRSVFTVSVIIGIMAFLGEARVEERITSLLFPVVALDLIMSVFFILFFYGRSKWQRAPTTSRFSGDSAITYANGQIMTEYADSNYYSSDHDISGTQSDYHAYSITDSSPSVNPASGLPMVNDTIDVGGNAYGFGDTSFVSYDHNTNQFSDFDYHNNP